MNRHRITPVFAALALMTLSACAVKPEVPFARFYAGGQPSIAGVAPNQSRLMFSILQELPESYGVQAVSGLTYASASVTLRNTSTAVIPTPVTKSVTLNPSHAASSVFSALRPGGGYAVSVSLRNNADAQVGSGVAEALDLPAGGTKTVTIVIGRDGQITVASSNAGNGFGTAGAYVLTKGDTVVLNTGFAGNEAAVATWSVILSSELYGTETKIGTFPASKPFNTFTWDTGTSSATGGFNFDHTKLTASATGGQNGTITFELYDADGKVIGRTALTHVSMLLGASINLQLQ